MQSSCMSITSTLLSRSGIERKRNAFIKKIEFLNRVERPDTPTFRVVFTGMDYILHIDEEYYPEFYDIAVQWIEAIKNIREKCTTLDLLQFFEAQLPGLTQYIGAILQLSGSGKKIIQFRYEVLQLWNLILSKISPEKIRNSIDLKAMKQIICTIFTTGHYKTQLSGVGVFGKYLHKYGEGLSELLRDIMPENELQEIRDIFLNINNDNFDLESRKLLNIFNMKISTEVLVYSIIAETIKCGNYDIKKPCYNGIEVDLWTDFNIATRTVSFFCNLKTFNQQNDQKWISIEAGVAAIKWKSKTELNIQIDGFIISNLPHNGLLKSINKIDFIFSETMAKNLRNSEILKLISPIDNSTNDFILEDKFLSQDPCLKPEKSLTAQSKPKVLCTLYEQQTCELLSVVSQDTTFNMQLSSCIIEDSEFSYTAANINQLDRPLAMVKTTDEIWENLKRKSPSKICSEKKHLNTVKQQKAEYCQNSKTRGSNLNEESTNEQKSIVDIDKENLPPATHSIVPAKKRKLFSHAIVVSPASSYVKVPAQEKSFQDIDLGKRVNFVKPLRGKSLQENDIEILEDTGVVNDELINPLFNTSSELVDAFDTYLNHQRSTVRRPSIEVATMQTNLRKINLLVKKTGQIFKNPEPQSIYYEVYDPRSIYALEKDTKPKKNQRKKHVVQKFMGKNKNVSFSYRTDASNLNDKVFASTIATAKCPRWTRNVKTKSPAVPRASKAKLKNSKINKAKSSDSIQCISTEIITKSSLEPNTFVQPKQPKAVSSLRPKPVIAAEINTILTSSKKDSHPILPYTDSISSITQNAVKRRSNEADIAVRTVPKRAKSSQNALRNRKENTIDPIEIKTHANVHIADGLVSGVDAENNNSMDIMVEIEESIEEIVENNNKSDEMNAGPGSSEINVSESISHIALSGRDWVFDRFFGDLFKNSQSKLSSYGKEEEDMMHSVGSTPNSIECKSRNESFSDSEDNTRNNKDQLNTTFTIEVELLQNQMVDVTSSKKKLEAKQPRTINQEDNSSSCAVVAVSPSNNQLEITTLESFLGETFNLRLIDTFKSKLNHILDDHVNTITQNTTTTLAEMRLSMKKPLDNIFLKCKHYAEKYKESQQKIQVLINELQAEYNISHEYTQKTADCSKVLKSVTKKIYTNYEKYQSSTNSLHKRKGEIFETTSSQMMNSLWQNKMQCSATNMYNNIMKHSELNSN